MMLLNSGDTKPAKNEKGDLTWGVCKEADVGNLRADGCREGTRWLSLPCKNPGHSLEPLNGEKAMFLGVQK